MLYVLKHSSLSYYNGLVFFRSVRKAVALDYLRIFEIGCLDIKVRFTVQNCAHFCLMAIEFEFSWAIGFIELWNCESRRKIVDWNASGFLDMEPHQEVRTTSILIDMTLLQNISW